MSPVNQHIIFRLLDEVYAINISQVQEIIKMKDICETPTPYRPYLLGVINVRGNVIPVVSLTKRLGKPGIPITPSTRIIIVQVQKQLIGMIVDAVLKVDSIEIEPFPDSSDEKSKSYCIGIAYLDDSIIPVLSLDHFLEVGEA